MVRLQEHSHFGYLRFSPCSNLRLHVGNDLFIPMPSSVISEDQMLQNTPASYKNRQQSSRNWWYILLDLFWLNISGKGSALFLDSRKLQFCSARTVLDGIQTQLWSQGCCGQRSTGQKSAVFVWYYCKYKTSSFFTFYSKRIEVNIFSIYPQVVLIQITSSLFPMLSLAKQLQESWGRLLCVWMKS